MGLPTSCTTGVWCVVTRMPPASCQQSRPWPPLAAPGGKQTSYTRLCLFTSWISGVSDTLLAWGPVGRFATGWLQTTMATALRTGVGLLVLDHDACNAWQLGGGLGQQEFSADIARRDAGKNQTLKPATASHHTAQ